jgi:hypothetical protein
LLFPFNKGMNNLAVYFYSNFSFSFIISVQSQKVSTKC